MFTLTLASLKGGTGKTTLAAHLAVEASAHGERVVVIDTDEQGSLAEWFNVREADEPVYAAATLDTLDSVRQTLKDGGYTFAIIDTPGTDKTALRAALRASDAALVPVRPSPNDIRAIGHTLAEIEAAALPFALVLSQRIARTKIAEQALLALSGSGPLASTIIGTRTIYAAAMIDGRAAQEVEPKGEAAKEIAELWRYVKTIPERKA